MAAKVRRSSKPNHSKTLAMIFMGSGLLILGLLTLAYLLKDSISAAPDRAGGDEGQPARVNFPAPELSLTDLGGGAVYLADYRGQVVLLNNWATWCPPCKAEMPVLQAFYEARRAQGFTIIAIEAGQPVEEVRAFVRDYRLTFPVWPDLEQKSLRAFRNVGLPNSYLIDREGAVRMVWNGAVTYAMLEKYVTPLLEE